MADPFVTSDNGIRLITFYEGFSSTPYFDYSQFSIGFGSGIDLDGNPVTASTPPINRRQAETLLKDVTLPIYEAGVANALVRNDLPIDALAALTSFTYNLGVGAFSASSLLARIEESKWSDVAYQFSRWINVTPADPQVSAALCQRRYNEYVMFRDAVIGAGLATATQFNYVFKVNDPQEPGPVPSTAAATGDIYDWNSFQNFCSISARRGLANVDRTDWMRNPVFDDNDPPNEIGQNPGPFFPNLSSGQRNDADDASTEATNQGVTPQAIGNDPRKKQAPLEPAGVPAANKLTPGGLCQGPDGGVGSLNVFIGGAPAVLSGAAIYNRGCVSDTPETVTGTKADVLVNGLPMVRTLDPTSKSGFINLGVPNVLTGK